MKIRTMQGSVALTPLTFDHDKGKGEKMVAGFVGTDKLAKTLIASQVVFDSKNFEAGQTVYLRADVYNAPQTKNLMQIDGKEFVLLPEEMVLAVKVVDPLHE